MRKTVVQTEQSIPGKIDALDCQILNLLQKDCRLSFNKIADKIGVSVGTAYNRIKNLEAKEVIRGYTTRIDSAKMGYGLTALILVHAENGYLTEVENTVANNPGVIAVYDITGEYDACIIAKFSDRNSLNVFLKQLSATSHVKRTLTNVVLTTAKEDFRVNFESK